MKGGNRNLLRFGAASLMSSLIDLTIFSIIADVLLEHSGPGIVAATVIARLLSGGCNFIFNRRWVFGSNRRLSVQMMKYLALFFTQMGCSALLVSMLSGLPLPLVVIKGLADGMLFLISYQIQHRVIFD